jgi:hypothetical protein
MAVSHGSAKGTLGPRSRLRNRRPWRGLARREYGSAERLQSWNTCGMGMPRNDAIKRVNQLGDYPVERLVLASLMQGLGELQTAIDEGQTSSSLEELPRGINADLCEAILEMKPDRSEVTWEVSVSWSPAWPVDLASLSQSVRLQNRSFEQIDAVGRTLRAGNKPRPGLLEGIVRRARLTCVESVMPSGASSIVLAAGGISWKSLIFGC